LPQGSLESQTAPPRLHFRVPPEPSHLLRARERLRDYLRQYCTEHQVIDDVVLCVEEACTNAIRHGDSLEDIEIALRFTHTKLVATVKDRGRGFNVASFDPEVPPDPMLDHGRGLYIVAKLMDSLDLRLDGGLEVRMTRRAAPRCEPASLESGLDGPHSGGGVDSRYSRVRAMLEEIDEGFIALDWEYRYVHVNEAMLRFTQTSRDELLGRVIWDLFPALEGSPVQHRYREAMELGRPSVFEHRGVVTGDWLEIRIYPTSVGVSAYYREINQRKRAETRLRESQALLQAVLDGSPDPVFVKDRESRMLLGNAALLEVWGKPAEEVIGKNDRELYEDPAIGETMMENDRAVMESGQSQVLEETVQTQDGLRTYLSTKSPYRNGEGKIVGILGIARDISERKRAESALRESEERFRSLFESTAEGIALHEVVYDEGGHATDYRIIDVNPSFESQTGMRAQDARGRLASELYGTGEAPYLAEYARVAEGGGPFCFETYFAPMERHFQITATSPSRGRFATIFEDITERKRVEEQLKRQADLLDLSFEPIIVWRLGGAIEAWNRGAAQLYGYSTDEALGQVTHELLRTIHPQPWASIEKSLRKHGSWEGELLHRAKDGREVVVLSRHQLVVGNDGIERVLESNRDITERKRAEEERQRLLEESQVQAEELAAQTEELQTQTEELQTQGEELQVQSEELQVQNAELLAHRDATLRESELRAGLNAIGALLHSTHEPDQVMRRALAEATRALAIDAAAIELDEGDTWPVRFAEGLPLEALGSPLTGEPVIARLVAHSGEALVLDDVAAHKTVGPFAARHGVRSLVAVPLVAREGILGVLLLVERRTVRHFGPADVDFARGLGSSIGLALDDARLLEREAQAARLAEVLNEMNGLINSTLDSREIMQTVVEQAVAAVGADSAMVALRHGEDWVAEYGYPEVPGVIHESVRSDEAPFMITAVTERRPIAIDDCDTDPRCIPDVQRRFGVRSVLCVPLIVREEVLGVIFFNHHEAAVAFPPAIVEFAGKLAASISTALANARLYEEQQRIATTLQENFLHKLPTVAGLELGMVTKTAHEPELVGGDFSDVFVLDDTHVVVLIGDVAGKGVRAAGLTETVRSTVRALAAVDSSPAFILGKTNELLLRYDPDEAHVTAFLAVLDPHTGHLSYASAGHPAPVHLGAFTCRTLDVAFGPPLGTFERPCTNAHAMLTLEDYLVLYTDGVTEARRDGELLGEQRLLEIVSGLRGRSAQEVAEDVRDAALAFAGQLRDDLQVVALRLA
jgi:PAS domain S-box-containing protein